MNQKQIIQFLGFWLVNTLIIILASLIFTDNIVLGNDKVSMWQAAMISAFILAAASLGVGPLVKTSGFKIKNENAWAGIFFALNTIVLWVLKRFALLLGLGIAGVFWVLILAALITLGYWGTDKIVASAFKTKGKK